jgi:DNA-binding SARP family transcriptional activator
LNEPTLSSSGLLHLEFLGPGEVRSPAGEVLLAAGIPLTLLAYVYQTPAGVSRDDLVQLFWPGRERGLGLQSLRQTLTRIRRALGEDSITSKGRLIVVDRTRFTSDLAIFNEAIETGDAARALSAWQGGGFLSGARVPESWEVEDWLERERSRYQGMILATLFVAGEQARTLPRASRETLAIFDEACLKFPLEERLQEIRFELNLKAGLLARASGFLEELRSQEDLGLPLDDFEAELEEARATAKSQIWAEVEDLEELPDTWEKSRRRPVLLSLGMGLLLLLLAFQAGIFGPRPPREADLAGHVITYCSQPATVQPGDSTPQLFRMDLDGRNKQRISGQGGCTFFWLEEAGVGVLLHWYSQTGQYWISRLRPRANPLTEWERVPLTARVEGFHPRGEGFHGGPVVAEGRYVIVEARNEEGQRAIFLVDPVADTLRQVTPVGPWYYTPVWDSIRKELILGAEVEGTRSLWAIKVLDPDAPWERLTDSPTQDGRPAIYGDRVLFVRGWGTGPTEGDYAILLLDRTTGQEEVLVSRPWNDFMPRWSPDGKHFCWTSEEFGHFESDIWVMELATRAMRNVTAKMGGRNYECRWGPDSRTLFFNSTTTGDSQVFRARRDNGFMENISRSNGFSEHIWILPRTVLDRAID